MIHQTKRQLSSSPKESIKHYAQNAEDVFIYSRIKSGTILEVGANSGTYLSNSKMLIEKGFSAYLLEPGETFKDLQELHKDNPKVHTYNLGIARENGVKTFYQSGTHDGSNTDLGLVSTTIPKEMERWVGVEFKETEAQFVTFGKFWNDTGRPTFDVISIDVEGLDWDVLQQINLKEVKCRFLIIEWNSIKELKNKFDAYCAKYRMKPIKQNAENIIYSIRP